MGHPLKLSAVGKPSGIGPASVMGRVTRQCVEPDQRRNTILLIDDLEALIASEVAGHAAIVCQAPPSSDATERIGVPMVSDVDTSHLKDGDVIAITRTGYVRTLYRAGSRHNVVFATDACNSYCLMCSQPPRPVDPKAQVAEHLRLLSLIPDVPPELGITGGEPTLLKDGLIEIVAACKERFPTTPLHMLSNGRLFYYGSFARRLADAAHTDLMIGSLTPQRGHWT